MKISSMFMFFVVVASLAASARAMNEKGFSPVSLETKTLVQKQLIPVGQDMNQSKEDCPGCCTCNECCQVTKDCMNVTQVVCAPLCCVLQVLSFFRL